MCRRLLPTTPLDVLRKKAYRGEGRRRAVDNEISVKGELKRPTAALKQATDALIECGTRSDVAANGLQNSLSRTIGGSYASGDKGGKSVCIHGYAKRPGPKTKNGREKALKAILYLYRWALVVGVSSIRPHSTTLRHYHVTP